VREKYAEVAAEVEMDVTMEMEIEAGTIRVDTELDVSGN
jgi:hypothetical protein